MGFSAGGFVVLKRHSGVGVVESSDWMSVDFKWVGENKINSKYALKFFSAVLLLAFLCAAGISAQSNYVENQSSLTEDSSGEIAKIEDDGTITYGNPAEKTGKKSGAASTVAAFLKMILVLAIVLAIIWIIFKLLQKSTGGGVSDDDKFLRRVAHLTVAPGKSVQVVTLVDRAFLIGVADDSINLIAELDDEEMINAMNLYADQHAANPKPRNFSEVLDLFMPKKKNQQPYQNMRKSDNVFEDGASRQILDSLKKQSERLNREDQ